MEIENGKMAQAEELLKANERSLKNRKKTQAKYPLRDARTITVAACDKNIGCKETA